MKIIDLEKVKYKSDPKKEILFVTLAVLFAAIATFTELENVRAAILIILVSLPISFVLFFIIKKTGSKVTLSSTAVLLTLGYLVPKVLLKSIKSQHIELALLWVAIEILAFLFLIEPRMKKHALERK